MIIKIFFIILITTQFNLRKTDKVKFIVTELERLYPKTPVPLNHKDPYTLLIAVLLSAQSTDKGVNKITPILFAKADNPYDMVKLSVNQIRNIIKPVGLSPMKSKGIHGLSKILTSVSRELTILAESPIRALAIMSFDKLVLLLLSAKTI